MSRGIRLAAGVTTLSIVAVVAFLAGGTLGFQYGRAFQGGQSATTEAVTVMTDLKRIEAGDVGAAVSSLESKLDGYFLSHAVVAVESNWLYDLWRLRSPYGDKLIRSAAEYRVANPHDLGEADIDSTIDAIISCLVDTSPDVEDSEFRAAIASCYRERW